MKPINTKGITYLEKLEGTTKWYWGTDYIHGDIIEKKAGTITVMPNGQVWLLS